MEEGDCDGMFLLIDIEHTATVTFLHPSIPSASFFYLKRKAVLDIDPSDILTRVHPTIATATGRTCTLSKKEVEDD